MFLDQWFHYYPKIQRVFHRDISNKILRKLKINVTVMIIDTDACYEIMGKQFTSLPIALDGIKSDLGIFGYLLREVW